MESISQKPYYPFILDHKPGFFLGWLLYVLFKRVRFNEDMSDELKRMHREGTVVYATKYRGHLDYLLYHYRFRRSRLPYPKVAFDLNIAVFLPFCQLLRIARFYIAFFFKYGRFPSPFITDFFKKTIEQGTCSLLTLVNPKGFARHFIYSEKDSLHFLLETQKGMDRPIYIVPQLILYRKTPEKDYSHILDIFFGFRENIGPIRKIVLFFRHNRRAFIDFGKPLNLKTYLKSQTSERPMEQMADEIKQTLIHSIDDQKRIILGPVMKSRQQLKEQVLKDSDIIQTIEEMASGNPKRLEQVRKTAGEYFDEIAADYNIAYIEFFQMSLKWLWKKIFEGIDVNLNEIGILRQWATRGPLIYVPSHKSHIDYLILNYMLYQHHMHIPRIAAGKNLSFWPMGYIFRKSGAFFIRRTFKGSRLYSKVFSKYIKTLLKEGHPLEFFIEGGRSRSGKLVSPKIGFLSILLQAYQEGYCEDLIFIPASISYDRILEEKSYLRELGGDLKKQENLKQIFRAKRFLKMKFGKVYIRFDHPIALSEYLDQNRIPEEHAPNDLAFHLIRSINKVTLVTPLALVATAILTKHRRGFLLNELMLTSEILMDFLNNQNISTATTLNNFEETIQDTLSLLVNRKVVNFLEDLDETETFYYIEEENKRELEYYKNSIIHFFIPHAFVAVSLLSGDEEIRTPDTLLDDFGFLKNLFKHEFVHPDETVSNDKILNLIKYFIEVSFISEVSSAKGYKLTRLGYDNLPIWAALVKTFLESYWVAARSFIQRGQNSAKRTDLLRSMGYLGLRFHKLGLIDHMEALSQVNFNNALTFIYEEILNGRGKSKKDISLGMEMVSQLSQRLYKLSRFRS
jgi:glycerol-3-phosphate O-acyltransferase